MSLSCAVCVHAIDTAVYRSPEPVSVTSLCEVRPETTEVYFCARCGHLQTPELADVATYYDQDYKILVDSEDEDQLYQLSDGRMVYRSEHQADVLLAGVALPQGAKVLDYGCAKAATLRRLIAARPDVAPHVFDISTMYESFWTRFVPTEQQATYTLPATWQDRFDLVTAFYSFEHMPDPRAAAAAIHTVLAPGGVFYGIVPDWTTNIADFIVVDHVQHFSASSLYRLLADAGFSEIAIDTAAHQGALVWTARKGHGAPPEMGGPPPSLGDLVATTAAYWRDFAESVRAFELGTAGDRSVAIYGSGFYGTFVTTCLQVPDRVVCYLDQNPHRQGNSLLGKPIVAPTELDQAIEVVYVGLNPNHARREIAKITAWQDRALTYFFP